MSIIPLSKTTRKSIEKNTRISRFDFRKKEDTKNQLIWPLQTSFSALVLKNSGGIDSIVWNHWKLIYLSLFESKYAVMQIALPEIKGSI